MEIIITDEEILGYKVFCSGLLEKGQVEGSYRDIRESKIFIIYKKENQKPEKSSLLVKIGTLNTGFKKVKIKNCNYYKNGVNDEGLDIKISLGNFLFTKQTKQYRFRFKKMNKGTIEGILFLEKPF